MPRLFATLALVLLAGPGYAELPWEPVFGSSGAPET